MNNQNEDNEINNGMDNEQNDNESFDNNLVVLDPDHPLMAHLISVRSHKISNLISYENMKKI